MIELLCGDSVKLIDGVMEKYKNRNIILVSDVLEQI